MPYTKALRVVRRHAPGARVEAWRNPADPRDAVLDRTPNAVLLGILAFAGFMLWFFGLAALAIRRHDAARNRTGPAGTTPAPID